MIIGLAGSLRPSSYTRAAVERVLAAVDGVEVKQVNQVCLSLPLCDGRAEDALPPTVVSLRQQVASARGLIIGTPVYNESFSAVMKNALEWLGPELITGRIVGIVAVAEGASAQGAASALQSLCMGMGAWVVPVTATVPLAANVFAEPDSPLSIDVFRNLDALGAAMPEACSRLTPGWPS